MYEKKIKNKESAGIFSLTHLTPGAGTYIGKLHFSEAAELVFVERGGFAVNLCGRLEVIGEGSIAFIDPYLLHSIEEAEPYPEYSVYLIEMSHELYAEAEKIRRDLLPSIFRIEPQGIRVLTALIEWGMSLGGRMSADMRRGFAALFFGAMRGMELRAQRTVIKRTPFSVGLVRYIGEHFAEDISLDQLADRFGYEKTYLSRMIGGVLGMNLREYLNRMRVCAAIEMKNKNPGIPMYRIAETCGFGSENTFYRSMRNYNRGEFEKIDEIN